MDASSLNQQLQAVYQPYLNTLYNQTWPAGVSAPLLMHVFEDYCRMDKKILFVGQETHYWENMYEHLSVELLQNKYTTFDLGKCADYKDGKPSRYLRSPFWNFSRSFFQVMNSHRNGTTRKTNGFLWTNVSKFDYHGQTPPIDLQQRNEAGFALLKDELAILQPDIVVFLTGHKYDGWIKQLFSPKQESLLGDYLYLLQDPNHDLPRLTFQTHHPHTLSRGKIYRAVLDKMAQQLATEYTL
ncbi:hypothetical protein [Spirosoma lituiforme]